MSTRDYVVPDQLWRLTASGAVAWLITQITAETDMDERREKHQRHVFRVALDQQMRGSLGFWPEAQVLESCYHLVADHAYAPHFSYQLPPFPTNPTFAGGKLVADEPTAEYELWAARFDGLQFVDFAPVPAGGYTPTTAGSWVLVVKSIVGSEWGYPDRFIEVVL